MGDMGYGYGSEWHLLRYFGRHRALLDEQIGASLGGKIVDWLDQPFKPRNRFLDAEWEGLNFLPKDHAIRRIWPTFWPKSGSAQNWDAVGRVECGGTTEWLLVEAKAHVNELQSRCMASERGGLDQIRRALASTKLAVGATEDRDWLCPYYQYANRLATLHFLRTQGVPARLLFIYFIGDSYPNDLAPATVEQWAPSLESMRTHLGLTGQSELESFTAKLFLPVCPGSANHPVALRQPQSTTPRAEG